MVIIITPLRFLLLSAFVLSLSACTSTQEKQEKKASLKTEESSAQKKVDVPAPRKPEPVEKPALPVVNKAEQELGMGIHHYEEGDYKKAAGYFQNALDGGLASGVDRIAAHKYLAFIYCISGEKLACRGEFKQVLRLNPKFNLTPAEAGHPLWGPVFRAVKNEVAGKKRRK